MAGSKTERADTHLRPHLPLVEKCLDSLWFGSAEHYVLEGVWASLKDRDQPGGLEPDGAERRDRRHAEPVTQLAPAPQVVRSQRAGPGRK
jgi:hypothetical protein